MTKKTTFRIIEAVNFFDTLKLELNFDYFESVKKSFEQTFELWKNCDIELSITCCLDNFFENCNKITSKPTISFFQQIEDADCIYMFAQSVLDNGEPSKDIVAINLLVTKDALLHSCHNCSSSCSHHSN